MASNRLLSRAWVGAMHPFPECPNDDKYIPIRAGRGLWNENRRGIIPWEEPEGYRTLIHEWGHYALTLTDEYLEKRQLGPLTFRALDLEFELLFEIAACFKPGQEIGESEGDETLVRVLAGKQVLRHECCDPQQLSIFAPERGRGRTE